MKKTGACPKCGSREIVNIPSSAGAFGAVFSAVKVSHYLCGGCGFIEEWIDDPENREKIKKKYGKGKP
jgi:hypothetical protein